MPRSRDTDPDEPSIDPQLPQRLDAPYPSRGKTPRPLHWSVWTLPNMCLLVLALAGNALGSFAGEGLIELLLLLIALAPLAAVRDHRWRICIALIGTFWLALLAVVSLSPESALVVAIGTLIAEWAAGLYAFVTIAIFAMANVLHRARRDGGRQGNGT